MSPIVMPAKFFNQKYSQFYTHDYPERTQIRYFNGRKYITRVSREQYAHIDPYLVRVWSAESRYTNLIETKYSWGKPYEWEKYLPTFHRRTNLAAKNYYPNS